MNDVSDMKYNDYRRKSKKIKVGEKEIGGDSKITIQSMTNTASSDIDGTYEQIKLLEASGCDIVRMAVPKVSDAEIFRVCKSRGEIKIPLVADIHFDYKIALECVNAGADKIRINPGNIGADWKVKEVAEACKANGIPIRIGVNSGSLEKSILEKYGSPTSEALAESALWHAGLLEKFGFTDIIVAIKSSRVKDMIEANRILAKSCEYPLHLGVTEAGGIRMGTIKSSAGIGSLLCDGIGDTVRVSLTADPIEEIKTARDLLKSIGVWEDGGLNIISCPTCGRTRINLIDLSESLIKAAESIEFGNATVTAAVMGCAVNGPGEAREADIGIAGGDGEALLFRKGKITGKIPETEVISALISEMEKIIESEKLDYKGI